MNLPDTLRFQRETMGFSLRAISDDLQLPLKYLQAFEAGDWTALPPRVYARGFLKKYAAYLDLDVVSMLAAFDAAIPLPDIVVAPDFSRRDFFLRSLDFLNRQKFAGILVLVGVCAGISYFGYEFRYVLFPPKLTLESPRQDMTIRENEIAVRGRVEKDADLWVNGRQLFPDEAGVLDDSVLLRPGLNTLIFEAKNRFGNIHTITRYIVVTR